jgi:hypothetical protein
MPTFSPFGVGCSVHTICGVSGYEFDIFISYSRHGSAGKWLMNHFYPKLLDCLHDELPVAPRVYVDKEMQRGVDWPYDLQKALLHSKIIMPLFTPPYFNSPWCLAEWQSMRARQELLGLASAEVPQGLVYPILYSDSDNFPMEARRLAWWNFKEFANPDLVYQQSREFINFHGRVVELARDLAGLLRQVPEWQPDWPIVEKPDPVLLPPTPLPRFGT